MAPCWQLLSLTQISTEWLTKMRKQKGAASEFSYWWDFVFSWPKEIKQWLSQLIAGTYRFEPMVTYCHEDEVTTVWNYRDRLITS